MKKATQVFSNDPTDSITRITIQADVKAEPYSDFSVQVSPAIAEFSSGRGQQASEVEINIRNTTTQDLGIEIVDISSEFIEGKLSSNVVGPSEEVKLKVESKRELKRISFTKSITLELNDQDSSRFTIPIRK